MPKRKFDDLEAFWDWIEEDLDPTRLDRRLVFERTRNWAAAFDALASPLRHLDKDSIIVPRWALEAVLRDVVKPALKASWRKRYEQDLIDWHRFREVWFRRLTPKDSPERRLSPSQARKQRFEFQKQQRQSAARLGSGHAVHPSIPYPWKPQDERVENDWTVYEAVSKLLERTIYAGSAPAIEKSFKKVSKALRNGEAWRYYPSEVLRLKGHRLSAGTTRGTTLMGY